MGNGEMASHDELLEALGSLEGLRDKGKVHPAFHFKSRAFLHFHRDDQGSIYADVRFGADWEKVPAATPAERGALYQRVEQHVEARP